MKITKKNFWAPVLAAALILVPQAAHTAHVFHHIIPFAGWALGAGVGFSVFLFATLGHTSTALATLAALAIHNMTFIAWPQSPAVPVATALVLLLPVFGLSKYYFNDKKEEANGR